MSSSAIETELAEYLAHSDYEVRFRHASSHKFFYTYVIYKDAVIAENSFHPPFASYRRAARWAKKRIHDHEQGMAALGHLVKP